MKRVAKGAGAVLAALLLVVLLVWTATFLYWHFRIGGAIRMLNSKDAPGAARAVEVLHSAGCRSLPYLVNAVDPENDDQVWIWRDLYFIAIESAARGTAKAVAADDIPSLHLLEGYYVEADNSVARRRERRDRIVAWWKSEGHRFHQGWRVWSSRCD